MGGLLQYPNILSEISAQKFYFVLFCALIFLPASSKMVIPLHIFVGSHLYNDNVLYTWVV